MKSGVISMKYTNLWNAIVALKKLLQSDKENTAASVLKRDKQDLAHMLIHKLIKLFDAMSNAVNTEKEIVLGMMPMKSAEEDLTVDKLYTLGEIEMIAKLLMKGFNTYSPDNLRTIGSTSYYQGQPVEIGVGQEQRVMGMYLRGLPDGNHLIYCQDRLTIVDEHFNHLGGQNFDVLKWAL